MADMELEGMDSLIRKLDDMGKAGTKLQNSALKKAGEVINEEIKANAPTSSTPRQPKPKTQLWRTGKHAKELLKVSGVKSKKELKYVDVGLQKGDTSKAFYLKFYEFGSSKTPATHFMSRAYESKKQEAQEIIKEELKNALKL